MVERPHFGLMGHNFFLGAPTALRALAHADQPMERFPVLAATHDPKSRLQMDFAFIEAETLPPLLVRKDADTPVSLSIYVRIPDELDENTRPVVVVAQREPGGDGAPVEQTRIEKLQMFRTKNPGRRDPRRWHLYLTLPAEAEAGVYSIGFPNAATITVLESNAEEIGLAATKDHPADRKPLTPP